MHALENDDCTAKHSKDALQESGKQDVKGATKGASNAPTKAQVTAAASATSTATATPTATPTATGAAKHLWVLEGPARLLSRNLAANLVACVVPAQQHVYTSAVLVSIFMAIVARSGSVVNSELFIALLLYSVCLGPLLAFVCSPPALLFTGPSLGIFLG